MIEFTDNGVSNRVARCYVRTTPCEDYAKLSAILDEVKESV